MCIRDSLGGSVLSYRLLLSVDLRPPIFLFLRETPTPSHTVNDCSPDRRISGMVVDDVEGPDSICVSVVTGKFELFATDGTVKRSGVNPHIRTLGPFRRQSRSSPRCPHPSTSSSASNSWQW